MQQTSRSTCEFCEEDAVLVDPDGIPYCEECADEALNEASQTVSEYQHWIHVMEKRLSEID